MFLKEQEKQVQVNVPLVYPEQSMPEMKALKKKVEKEKEGIIKPKQIKETKFWGIV